MGRDGKGGEGVQEGRGRGQEGVGEGVQEGFLPLPLDLPSGGLPGLPYPFPWGEGGRGAINPI